MIRQYDIIGNNDKFNIVIIFPLLSISIMSLRSLSMSLFKLFFYINKHNIPLYTLIHKSNYHQ